MTPFAVLKAIPRPNPISVVATVTLLGALCPLLAPMLVACDNAACRLVGLAALWPWAWLTLALWLLARTDGYAQKASILAAVLILSQLAMTWPAVTP